MGQKDMQVTSFPSHVPPTNTISQTQESHEHAYENLDASKGIVFSGAKFAKTDNPSIAGVKRKLSSLFKNCENTMKIADMFRIALASLQT